MNLTRAHKLAGLFAAGLLIADQMSKYWILQIFKLQDLGSVEIFSFFNLTMVWNRGISLGLFQASDDLGRYILIGGTSLITIFLVHWFAKERDKRLLFGLAMIIGGSVGNIIDRIRFGAVADFLHFHGFGYSFYVFNVADAAITLGVAFLLWDALLSPQKSPT